MSTETKPPRRESLRGAITRNLLGPHGEDNWGKQVELERALKAIDSIQTAAQHFSLEDLLRENEGKELETVFTAELMDLRAQFERVKRAQTINRDIKVHHGSERIKEAHYENKQKDSQEEIHNSDISVETMGDKWRHNGERVSLEYIVISEEPDPILYDVPAEFLEGLDRMMVSPLDF